MKTKVTKVKQIFENCYFELFESTMFTIKKFKVGGNVDHFTKRLKERADISIPVFRKAYAPKICQELTTLGLKKGTYAFVYNGFIIIANFKPFSIKNKKFHNLFLITALERKMHQKDFDYEVMMEQLKNDFTMMDNNFFMLLLIEQNDDLRIIMMN